MRREPYPIALQSEIMHAVWFAHVLSVLAARRGTSAPLSVWLTGRADEVTAFIGATLDDWSSKRVDTFDATITIREYVAGLHHALRARFRKPVRLACCAADSGDHAVRRVSETVPRASRDTLLDIDRSGDPEDLEATLEIVVPRMPQSA